MVDEFAESAGISASESEGTGASLSFGRCSLSEESWIGVSVGVSVGVSAEVSLAEESFGDASVWFVAVSDSVVAFDFVSLVSDPVVFPASGDESVFVVSDSVLFCTFAEEDDDDVVREDVDDDV